MSQFKYVLLDDKGSEVATFAGLIETIFDQSRNLSIVGAKTISCVPFQYSLLAECEANADGTFPDINKARGGKIVMEDEEGPLITYGDVYASKVEIKSDDEGEQALVIEFVARKKKVA